MDLEYLKNIVKALHRLNFGTGGLIEFGENYSFGELQDGKHTEHALAPNLKVCERCNGCEVEAEFTRITHGTHTFDFLDAHRVDHTAVADWSQKPVLFVMENPGPLDSRDKPMGARHISEQWYWVTGQYDYEQCLKCINEDFIYPNFFVQKEYGWMIYSVIRTFKMANAYVTNMVKCGMASEKENGKEGYLTTDEYPEEIVNTCIVEHLKKELDCLRGDNKDEKVIVFAFGERTYNHLKGTLQGENISLYLLPHPANRLANDYRKYVLFGKILRGLLQNYFYDGVKEKPDFEAILAADIDEEEPEKSFEELCVEELERICKEKNYELKKRKSYDSKRNNEVICYTFTVNADDVTESLVLRQAIKGKQYAVSWAKYRFDDKSISLYAGKKSTANVWIEDKNADEKEFPILSILKAFAEAYQTKYMSPNGPDQE